LQRVAIRLCHLLCKFLNELFGSFVESRHMCSTLFSRRTAVKQLALASAFC
jgi:hypothetical protein